ncbi:MAG TPA: ABC transporter ATP-binding protein [Acidimicrobiales bacterium]|nr:ABC transporter ATP-binding protein [Acidimicrobiales bacterium]
MLEIEELCVSAGAARLIWSISMTVPTGSWAALVGPNGAGKTTLCRGVTGLIDYQGKVRVAGRDFPSGRNGRARAKAIAYVPQKPVLPPAMAVTDYVLLGRFSHHSYLGAETAQDRRVARDLMERLELDHLCQRPLGQLSGGEAQRVVLARALAQEAPLLVMDEPTASLDLGHAQSVLELVDELRRERSLTVLWAVHDLTLAAQYAATLSLLSAGHVVVEGPPHLVLSPTNIDRFFGARTEVFHGTSGPVVAPVRPFGANRAHRGPAQELRTR